MAQRFIDQANAQLAPLYDQQVQAQQAQIPAIQNLYKSLLQGLEGTAATQTQNIVEDASRRGVLRSTLPVDSKQQLAGQILQQQGQFGAQEAKEIAGIQSNIGQINLSRATGIQQLADSLYQADLSERKFQMEQQLASQAAAYKQSGGGGGKAPALPKLQAARGEVTSYLSSKVGKDGYVSPSVYKRVKDEFLSAGFTEKDWLGTAKRFKNPNTKY